MNYSKLFMNAILNLYKCGVYTVDYAILKTSEYADKNKINASDYESAITFLAEEQAKQMIPTVENTEEVIEAPGPVEETTESVENVDNVETTDEISENKEKNINEMEM